MFETMFGCHSALLTEDGEAVAHEYYPTTCVQGKKTVAHAQPLGGSWILIAAAHFEFVVNIDTIDALVAVDPRSRHPLVNFALSSFEMKGRT